MIITLPIQPQLVALQKSLLASTQGVTGLAEVNKNLRTYSEKLAKVTQTFRERLNAILTVVKESPYYLFHMAISARRSALKWLTERLERLTGKALKNRLLQAIASFRLSQKLESLIKIFPTSSSVNP